MTSGTRLVAALLTVAAALTSTAADAAVAVAGSRGPPDKPHDRGAPLTLPGKFAARAPPRIEAATLSRGIFDEDQVAALANLGTVTLSANGDLVETPASDALRGIFEDAVRGHRSGQ
jgi:hypothetical protein